MIFALPYEVVFSGLDNPKALRAVQDASDLIALQSRPPASINGIRYRIQGDLPQMLEVLRAFGYYDAEISTEVEEKNETAEVTIKIHSGPQYTLRSYEVFKGDCTIPAQIACCPNFTPEKLGLQLGSSVLSVNIVNAELNLLSELARCGYPLASIEKRKVIVDMQEKDVEAATCIDEGPYAKFGPMSIFGLKTVKSDFVLDRITWKEGQGYSSDFVEHTQKRLLNSDLFSSVLISHGDQLDENGEIPIRLRLSEAKHRQIALGIFYATVDGPGGMFNWTNRNLRGVGETLSLNGEFSKRYLTGILTYKKRDLFMEDQDLKLLAQIERQEIKAFTSFIYRFASLLEQSVDRRRTFSIGIEAQHINVANSANNGSYDALDLPILARYDTVEDLLNPIQGYSIVYQPHFFQLVGSGNHRFMKQRLTMTFYLPLIQKWFVFAGRLQFGSIAGARQKNIPLPLLFLGGSEDDLRGYRYLTVSPLNDKNKPLGGRSAIFLSAETRFRFGNIGIVPFADFGTVTFDELPTVDAKWFKSIGIGLRYFAFFGPLRFDVGFPLDRRSIDPAFRIYASIGQTF